MFSQPPLLTTPKGTNRAEDDTVTTKTPSSTATTPIIITKDEPTASLSKRPPRNMNTDSTLLHEKTTFRHSLASQYSSTSASGSSHSQRYSVGSAESLGQQHYDINLMDNNNNNPMRRWSAESNGSDHVSSQQSTSSPTASSFSSLPPSSRFLLSGATSSEAFREQELSRFYPTTTSSTLRHIKALSDPFVNMPSVAASSGTPPSFTEKNNHTKKMMTHSTNSSTSTSSSSFQSNEWIGVDPWCMSVKSALEKAICKNWIYKYEQPTFTFARAWKRRYVILVDKIVYIFKSNKSTHPAREHFILTEDTLVFVSEEFKKGYVVEIRKPLCKWYLRCESASQMKHWLESMKKIVACVKVGHSGKLSSSMLANLQLTDDYQLLSSSTLNPSSTSPRNSIVIEQQPISPTTMASPSIHKNKTTKYRLSAIYHRTAAADALNGTTSSSSSSTPTTTTHNKKNNDDIFPYPPQWWKYYQQQYPTLQRSENRRASAQVTKTTTEVMSQDKSLKRQSLAEIPHWQSLLPPQRPVPLSTPPPPPPTTTTTSSSSTSLPTNLQPSISTSSTKQPSLAPVSEDT
ncbi:hypothetical protein BDC45DRAFT_497327 [Circinella umbellata]|nr:hypothetical protein BDC45DRAFT_497327 [Circinella umbellata]